MAKNKKSNFPGLSISKKNIFITSDAEETRQLGAIFSKLLKSGDIVFLNGDLGAGKTTFTQGIAKAFGNAGFARSSSFMLVCEYSGGAAAEKFFHLDLYRLAPAGARDIGIEEYLYGKNISAVEWAERLVDAQNDKTWNVDFKDLGNSRKITIEKTK